MAHYTIFFNDLKEEVQESLKSQLREEIMSDKEYEWETESEGMEYPEDYIDSERDEFDLELAVDDYINENNIGVDYDI